MKTTYVLCSVAALVGLSVGAGCWGFAESHCGNLDGDQTCSARGSGMYCDTCRPENDGCSDVMPSDGCRFGGSEGETSAATTATTSSTDTDHDPALDTSATASPVDTTSEVTSAGETTLALTGDPGTTTGGPECQADDDCPEPIPYCAASGVCVGCSGTEDPDAVCGAGDPNLPLCVNDGCVSCDDGLMLSGPMGSCLPCIEHDQCSSGACDIFEGTCFDPERVVDVGGGMGQPNTIEEGLAELQMLGVDRRGERRGVIVLHENNGGPVDFGDTVTINAADYDAVAFIGAPGQVPDWRYNGMPHSPTLTANSATRVYLDHILIRNDTNATHGQSVLCDDARVDIRRSRLVENLGGGIVAQGQCELVVHNSFIGVNSNNPSSNNPDALRITDASVTATILYTTLGAGPGGEASALSCVPGASVDVRNSLLVSLSAGPEVDCPDAVLTTSASEAGGLGDMSESWFIDYDGGDFHLDFLFAPAGTVAAQWFPGDPTTDIDGGRRILDQLARAGADAPPP